MTTTDAVALAAAVWVAWGTRPRPPVRRVRVDDRATNPPAVRGRTMRPRCRGRRVDTGERAEALAAWCADVARLLRSGESLAAATAGVGAPSEPRLIGAVAALGRGEAPDVDAPVHRDVALVLGVLAGVHSHGGAAAEPLDRAAAVLRSRAALIAEATTQSAQARWSAQVMTALPTAMLAVLLAASPPVRAAVSHPIGVGVLTAGVALNLAGWWWLRALLARPTA